MINFLNVKMLFVFLMGYTVVALTTNTQPFNNIEWFEVSAPSQTKSASISNDYLKVVFNTDSKSLELLSKLNDKIIIKEIIPAEATNSINKKKITDSTFGMGNSLTIYSKNGGSTVFTLYKSQPFLFITQVIKNDSKKPIDLQKLNPIDFVVNFGKTASKLKTLGTGGLLSPDNNPGSYVFLTTVDPETHNGVVTGWLTNEKGSGVLFSTIQDGLVKIKAQIDYGHFVLPAGKSEATEILLIGYFDDARLGQEQFTIF